MLKNSCGSIWIMKVRFLMFNNKDPTLTRWQLEIIDCICNMESRGKKMFNEMNKGNIEFNYQPKFKDIFLSTKSFYVVTNDVDNESLYQVHGFFFFDTQYGESGALILDNCNVYIPKHLVDTFKEIKKDPKAVQAVKDGMLGITLHTYKSHGKDCVGLNLVDIEKPDKYVAPTEFDVEKAKVLSEEQ